MDKSLKRGSVTMTGSSIVIAFSKEAPLAEPSRRVGYDLNEKSIVGSDGTRHDLAEVARLHTLYGVRRSRFYERHPGDRRLKKKYASSMREKERVSQALHRVSTLIVEKARANNEAIVLERLKGIRYAHRKGNGEGRATRRRIAQWPFRMLQSYIDYKARWAGVPIEFVSAAYTSKMCYVCGYINHKLQLTERSWLCPQCGAKLERDANSSINIERRGKIRCLGEVHSGARGKDEAVKGNETTTPILEAEAPSQACEKSSRLDRSRKDIRRGGVAIHAFRIGFSAFEPHADMTVEMMLEFREIKGKLGIGSADFHHIATASAEGCPIFATTDERHLLRPECGEKLSKYVRICSPAEAVESLTEEKARSVSASDRPF